MDELESFRDRVNAVRPDDIERVAKAFLHPDRLSIVLVGNAAAFASQLRGLVELVAQETGLPVRLANEPMTCVARGCAALLENLDALLSGERSAWLHVRVNKDQVLEVKIDNALQEARAQTTVLRNLITDIHRHRARIPMQDDPDDDVLVGLT